jgi:hypothetical protein
VVRVVNSGSRCAPGAGYLAHRPHQHLARLGAIGRADDALALHALDHPRRAVAASAHLAQEH